MAGRCSQTGPRATGKAHALFTSSRALFRRPIWHTIPRGNRALVPDILWCGCNLIRTGHNRSTIR
eukprot:1981942-Pyramimonas_sp.AAC.4